MTGILFNFINVFYPKVTPESYKYRKLAGLPLFAFLFLVSFSAFSQEPDVSSSVDTTSIKIGEQMTYQIEVEADSTRLVVFPEPQSFNPMEVVEALTDTTRVEDRFRLIKKYLLTQFDSGSYTIPQQRVLINDTPYFTDSVSVEVANVVVDTTKQKMYSIKPAMEVPSTFNIPNWVWWLLGILLLAGLAFYFFRRRKKKKEAAAKVLPPYERAMLELQQLDQSHLLENRETKEYYSKLTEAVRRYLEDEVNLRAMESTTSELITYLELRMQSGDLKLTRETIDNLKIILQRADLAKFANIKPDIITAKADRSKIENVINDTKAAIPEPTEEERLKDEAYKQELIRRRNKKRLIISLAAGVGIIAIAVTILVSTKGFDYLKESLIGHPTKELLQGEWIRSEYGEPGVAVTTPRVLVRSEIDLPEEAKEMMVGSETFIDGNIAGDFYVIVSTVKFREGIEFDLDKAVEGIYAELEKKGAKNIVVKNEDFTTLEGVEGIRVFGTLEFENPVTGEVDSKNYSILNFAQGGGFQQITVIFDEEDQYADEISGRIINSVEFDNSLP